jgi:hypothetical protein
MLEGGLKWIRNPTPCLLSGDPYAQGSHIFPYLGLQLAFSTKLRSTLSEFPLDSSAHLKPTPHVTNLSPFLNFSAASKSHQTTSHPCLLIQPHSSVSALSLLSGHHSSGLVNKNSYSLTLTGASSPASDHPGKYLKIWSHHRDRDSPTVLMRAVVWETHHSREQEEQPMLKPRSQAKMVRGHMVAPTGKEDPGMGRAPSVPYPLLPGPR